MRIMKATGTAISMASGSCRVLPKRAAYLASTSRAEWVGPLENQQQNFSLSVLDGNKDDRVHCFL